MTQLKLNFSALPSSSSTSTPSTSSSVPRIEQGSDNFDTSPSVSNCQCQCCLDPSTPFHPDDLSISAGVSQTYMNKGTSVKTVNRRIQQTWFKQYPWISVCMTTSKIYCATCRSAKNRNLLTFPKHYKSAFVDDGFQNLKKALDRFREHEASVMHKEAVLKLAAISSSSVRINSLITRQLDNEQVFHRKMLIMLLSCIKYLCRQGLPLRGHHEDSVSFEGNLYQLLLHHAQDSPVMANWLQKREYISPEIVNELIKKMGLTVLRHLLDNIRKSLWFSILADEATDICNNEQLSISIRWIDQSYNIHEDVIGLIQLLNTKAVTIFSVIKDILVRCSLPLAQCRGQAYDGAANMSGVRNGVQALVKSETSKALYVHCLAHNLNLCLKDVTCDVIRNVMDFISNLVQLIRYSPKRLSLFESLKKDISLQTGANSPSLRILCPTRWTIRHMSINSIISNYSTLQAALEEIKQGRDEYASKANGLLARMENFETFFGLRLAYLVFSSAEQVSINLQSVDITVQEALKGAELLVKHFKSLRKDSTFNTFYDSICKESEHLTEEPILPRQRKIPRRYDTVGQAHEYESPKDRYRHTYFEVLELAVGEVERRFDQPDVQLLKEVEDTLLKAGNGENVTISPTLESFVENDIDLERLKHQLTLVQQMIQTANSSIIKVTSVRTVADAMNTSNIYKTMLTEIDLLLKLYFTCPVTTASVERSFSSLRRLKTYLRSTMTEQIE